MFFTIEGIDGSGKTTQVSNLAKKFQEKGIETLVTREPGGGGEVGAFARKILSGDVLPDNSNKFCEILLVYAARVIHVENEIKPALRENKVVICDRFIDSSIAYFANEESVGFNKAYNIVHNLHKTFLGGFMPHKTFFIDTDSAEAKGRIEKRIEKIDKYDLVSTEVMNQTRERFLKIQKNLKTREMFVELSKGQTEQLDLDFNKKQLDQRIVTINGNQDTNDITEEIFSIMLEDYKRHN